MSFATLRQDLADALANPSAWNVYAYPPMEITAQSIVIQPADGSYIEVTNGSHQTPPIVHLKLTLVVQLFDNQAALNNLETFMQQVFQILSVTSYEFRWGNFTTPQVTPIQAGQGLSTDLNLSIVSSWE